MQAGQWATPTPSSLTVGIVLDVSLQGVLRNRDKLGSKERVEKEKVASQGAQIPHTPTHPPPNNHTGAMSKHLQMIHESHKHRDTSYRAHKWNNCSRSRPKAQALGYQHWLAHSNPTTSRCKCSCSFTPLTDIKRHSTCIMPERKTSIYLHRLSWHHKPFSNTDLFPSTLSQGWGQGQDLNGCCGWAVQVGT